MAPKPEGNDGDDGEMRNFRQNLILSNPLKMVSLWRPRGVLSLEVFHRGKEMCIT
jgi:hypothetical protein